MKHYLFLSFVLLIMACQKDEMPETAYDRPHLVFEMLDTGAWAVSYKEDFTWRIGYLGKESRVEFDLDSLSNFPLDRCMNGRRIQWRLLTTFTEKAVKVSKYNKGILIDYKIIILPQFPVTFTTWDTWNTSEVRDLEDISLKKCN